jgi:hypothetical protein
MKLPLLTICVAVFAILSVSHSRMCFCIEFVCLIMRIFLLCFIELTNEFACGIDPPDDTFKSLVRTLQHDGLYTGNLMTRAQYHGNSLHDDYFCVGEHPVATRLSLSRVNEKICVARIFLFYKLFLIR